MSLEVCCKDNLKRLSCLSELASEISRCLLSRARCKMSSVQNVIYFCARFDSLL